MKASMITALATCVIGLGMMGGVNAKTNSSGKPSVAVAEFKNTSSAGWWNGSIGWELSGMLSNELAATGKFSVLERDKLEKVMEEQNLMASGRAKAGKAAQMGKIVGAQYLVTGTVTAYEESTKSGRSGMSFGGLSLKNNSAEAYIAIDIRVIDTTTGEISHVRTIEGTSKSGGSGVGLSKFGFSGDTESEKKSPAGRAVRGAVVRVSEYLDCVMVRKDGCESQFQAQDDRRRKKTSDSISID
jgi:curli biogenesis system outer membrane secretion channel CsgG